MHNTPPVCRFLYEHVHNIVVWGVPQPNNRKPKGIILLDLSKLSNP